MFCDSAEDAVGSSSLASDFINFTQHRRSALSVQKSFPCSIAMRIDRDWMRTTENGIFGSRENMFHDGKQLSTGIAFVFPIEDSTISLPLNVLALAANGLLVVVRKECGTVE